MKHRALVLFSFLFVASLVPTRAFATTGGAPSTSIEPKAREIILAAAQYLRDASSISLKGMSTSEEVTPSNEKFQFDSTTEAVVVRPNKFFLNKSGYENIGLWSDGNSIVILDKAHNKYSRIATGGDMQAAHKKLDEFGIETPFSGLFDPELGKSLDKRVRSAKYLGETRLIDVECHHVALRQDEVDWQIWVDKATNAPRKMVITSKMVTGSPQHSLLVTSVQTGERFPDSTFLFKAPAGSQEVPILSFGKHTPDQP